MRCGGFILTSLQEQRNRVSISRKETYRIMCLGESTTFNQYPLFLEEILNQRNIGIKFSVIDKGVSGTNTGAILSNLESSLNIYHPDMVITMMGINDWGMHMPREADSGSKVINYLKSFKTYKLIRLFWLHMVARINELRFNKIGNNANQINPGPPVKISQQVYAVGKDGLVDKELQELKKAIEVNPKNDEAYVELGGFYCDIGKLSEAEATLRKALRINPKNDEAYVELGCYYHDMRKLPEAEATLRKALRINPKNDEAYVELGCYYYDIGKLSEVEAAFRKAIEVNPKNDEAYVELGRFYHDIGKLSEVEAAFRKAIEVNPKNDEAYVELGGFYCDIGKLSEAEAAYREALRIDPEFDEALGALGVLYAQMGNARLSEEYKKRAEGLRVQNYRLSTVDNYSKLRIILDKRKITYVCVQYPMRGIDPLKRIFKNDPEGIIFVDNEKVFIEALKSSIYREYFNDRFGGDFGHCTDKGNRLLAENIADVILEEVFGRK